MRMGELYTSCATTHGALCVGLDSSFQGVILLIFCLRSRCTVQAM